ncbi:MAG: aminotransferase class III-fold pyridoxal phosphate-dependent enzyme [Kiritimatiellae bacterium]|nr:aminotransferase class III-fold pyridoxal phosphate-dependent enzyme [Verrucomicrobiota bacterium]MCG2679510.1 aminotransferase class III-fold pyridoxal phosphate-dependent enzyme [Kiritimatiellia bacterium]
MTSPLSNCGRGQLLYKKAKQLIPGGTQLLSKRPEMFLPDYWPAYYERAAGADVWDLDGKRYVDMSYCGIGSTVLGYSDPDVNTAVKTAIGRGNMCTLNAPEEVELAELLLDLHPWAEMVRFGRCGGEAMAVAVRIARAATGRDKVAFCGYHGWHDWYLAANLKKDDALNQHLLPGLDPAGVPRGLLGTALPFHYNKTKELQEIVTKHRKELAAIVMEPMRDQEPTNDFLQAVRKIANETGAKLIFDEVTSGFRVNTGGVHLKMGVEPDIAVFAKAMGNGYPMSAVVGRANVMQAAQKSFISSTYWTERIGPVAALATIKKFKERNVSKHLILIGGLVKSAWLNAAKKCGLKIHVGGLDPLAHFRFEGPEGQEAKTLFTQLMLERGFLASTSFYAMLAHTPAHVQEYSRALRKSFAVISNAMSDGRIASLLKGPVSHSGFARLT